MAFDKLYEILHLFGGAGRKNRKYNLGLGIYMNLL